MSKSNGMVHLQGSWWLLVYVSCFLWVLPISLLILNISIEYTKLAVIYGWFIAWIIMPVAIYDDIKFVKAKSNWEPQKWRYLLPALVPFFAVIPGLVYLVQRRRYVGIP